MDNIVALLTQALAFAAMLAAWTTSKIDDSLVRIIQIILRNEELLNEVEELLKNLKPATDGGLNAALQSTDLAGVVTGSLTEQHNAISAAVNERFDGVAAANDKVRAILEREGIDWAKWKAMLPLILQILSMFMK